MTKGEVVVAAATVESKVRQREATAVKNMFNDCNVTSRDLGSRIKELPIFWHFLSALGSGQMIILLRNTDADKD